MRRYKRKEKKRKKISKVLYFTKSDVKRIRAFLPLPSSLFLIIYAFIISLKPDRVSDVSFSSVFAGNQDGRVHYLPENKNCRLLIRKGRRSVHNMRIFVDLPQRQRQVIYSNHNYIQRVRHIFTLIFTYRYTVEPRFANLIHS